MFHHWYKYCNGVMILCVYVLALKFCRAEKLIACQEKITGRFLAVWMCYAISKWKCILHSCRNHCPKQLFLTVVPSKSDLLEDLHSSGIGCFECFEEWCVWEYMCVCVCTCVFVCTCVCFTKEYFISFHFYKLNESKPQLTEIKH